MNEEQEKKEGQKGEQGDEEEQKKEDRGTEDRVCIWGGGREEG